MKPGITIYDIADKAGVSIATVSRVLNNNPRVSSGTRDRVCTIAKAMGYQPHASARSLAKKQSHLISAVIPMMTSYFYLEVLQGVQDRIAESEFDLLVHAAPQLEDVDEVLDQALSKGRAAGVLLFSSPLTEKRITRMQHSRQPVVLVDRFHKAFDSVSIDNEKGGYMAAEHLFELGYRRLGLITANPESTPSMKRMEGYLRAHKERNIASTPDFIVSESDPQLHGYTEEAGYEGMRKILAREHRPEAVFVVSDIQALGAMRAVEDAGLSVPHDIALVGFDDIIISRYVGLSTLRQPMYDMGKMAMDLLLKRLHMPQTPVKHTVFLPELISRNSSTPIAGQ